jgi:tetratricopeptide (TPR) repeat protein
MSITSMSRPPVNGIWKLGVSALLLLPAFAQTVSVEDLAAQGRDLQSQGEFVRAERFFLVALSQSERDPSDPMRTAAVLDCLAANEAGQARYTDAERLLLRALSIVEHTAGPRSKAAATVLWHLAGLYGEAGRFADAQPLLRKYESIIVLNAASDPGAAANDLGNLGRIYAFRHAPKRALPLFERAVELLEKQRDPDDIDMARALLDRAIALGTIGELNGAIADVERASVLIARFPHSLPALEIDFDITAGGVYARARRAGDAELAFQHAIRLAESYYGLTHPVLALVLRNYSGALRLLGEKKRASTADARARRIYSANSQSNPLGRAVDVRALRP